MTSIEERLAALEARIVKLEPKRFAVHVPARVERLEEQLGKYWLSRIGVVSLITGVALLIVTYFAELGPFVRIGLGYAVAAAVAWTGLWLAKSRETFGRIVFGGGLAIAYFVTYALHFVTALRVIDNQIVGIALVAGAVFAIVVIAHHMQSETVAGIALFLGLHTGLLAQVTSLQLITTTLLAAGAAFFLAKNRWVIVPLSTVIAVYSTHATVIHDATPGVRAAFVGIDFALFAIALLIGPKSAPRPLALLGAMNWIGALVFGSWALWDLHLFVALCVYAAVLATIAAIAYLRREAPAIVALQIAYAIITLGLAMPVRFDGSDLATSWLILAIVPAVIARVSDARFSILAMMLVVAAYKASLPIQIAAVIVMFAVERLQRADSPYRALATLGVAVGLARLDVPYHVEVLVGSALLLFALGFTLRAMAYRWAGFAMLLFAAGRLLLDGGHRIAVFIVGGLVMLTVSFIYTRRDAT
ncbi:MAG: DUF2339 domain-containing protein [Kofleriaceae bacterium]